MPGKFIGILVYKIGKVPRGGKITSARQTHKKRASSSASKAMGGLGERRQSIVTKNGEDVVQEFMKRLEPFEVIMT